MANFILRKVDDTLWAAFRARAAKEGHPMRWVLMELIKAYIARGLTRS
jgi:plasmid stability protein